MIKINLSRKMMIKIAIAAALAGSAVFANFIAIRLMTRYVIEADFYNRLSAAYDAGSLEGVKIELSKIKSRSKMQRQLMLVEAFEKEEGRLQDMESFIDRNIAESTQKIYLLGNLRRAAFVVIFLILILKVFLNKRYSLWKKGEEETF